MLKFQQEKFITYGSRSRKPDVMGRVGSCEVMRKTRFQPSVRSSGGFLQCLASNVIYTEISAFTFTQGLLSVCVCV